VPASAAGKPLEIWFADEARVGQQGTLTYVWARLAEGSVRRSRMEGQAEARRGSRPPAVRDNRHDAAYLFGAVCPQRRVGAALIMPAVNSEPMAEHLQEISTQVVLSSDVGNWTVATWRTGRPHHAVPSTASALPLRLSNPDRLFSRKR
jgi:hypothetical protein